MGAKPVAAAPFEKSALFSPRMIGGAARAGKAKEAIEGAIPETVETQASR